MSHDANATFVHCSIDFDQPGYSVGRLSVPHSRDESAWGVLQVPIACINGGKGHTILFTAASHGDEYEGPVALLKLIRDLQVAEIQGRVIVLPALNLPALQAGRRLSPVDGLNMNRVFPGDPRGTITERIAHYVATELVSRADVVVDLHSGGQSLKFLPAAIVHELDDPKMMDRTLAALRAFRAPVGLVLREIESQGMLDTFVEEAGKIFLSTELGGAGVLTPETVHIAER
ncbi:MAG: succinylglutamate desuccinylase/aspartoacylase family protein, partial [Myxococcales bacterium]|nr:succinylglutamate desuccinylase/aspartoacylase family protein [Myxococcales bacterium]